jgi:hypothetical protein
VHTQHRPDDVDGGHPLDPLSLVTMMTVTMMTGN